MDGCADAAYSRMARLNNFTYMFNIVWDFQKQFYKIAIVSQCHKPNSVDLPQLIEHVQFHEY